MLKVLFQTFPPIIGHIYLKFLLFVMLPINRWTIWKKNFRVTFENCVLESLVWNCNILKDYSSNPSFCCNAAIPTHHAGPRNYACFNPCLLGRSKTMYCSLYLILLFQYKNTFCSLQFIIVLHTKLAILHYNCNLLSWG